jgi:hypothetical protein
MAPGPKLPADSPMGKDIKSIVREMLKEELSLTVIEKKSGDEEYIIQLKLGDELIGKPFIIDFQYDDDNGHWLDIR